MRIGISLTTAYPAGVPPRTLAAGLVDRVRAARRAGLDSLFVGDHHGTGPANYFQNVPTMGRLLAEWGDAPFGILCLLPLWHPVLLAEQVGTLAAFGSGRFVLQVSLGHGARQFAALGGDLRRRVGPFETNLSVLRRLLAGEEVDGTRIAPVPEEPVEYWLGGTADAALDRAARLCDGFLATPDLDVAAAADRAAYYRAACAAAGSTPGPVAIRRDVYVGADAAEARRTAAAVLAGGYRGFPPDVLVVGAPDEVAARFDELGRAGYTDVIVRHVAVDQRAVVASTERLAEVRALLTTRPVGGDTSGAGR